jgi:hypothetical protein
MDLYAATGRFKELLMERKDKTFIFILNFISYRSIRGEEKVTIICRAEPRKLLAAEHGMIRWLLG